MTTIIAKNQTGGALALKQLPVPGNELPASPAAVTLTDYATVVEIQNDPELLAHIVATDVILNDGTNDLSTADSLQFITPVATTTVLTDTRDSHAELYSDDTGQVIDVVTAGVFVAWGGQSTGDVAGAPLVTVAAGVATVGTDGGGFYDVSWHAAAETTNNQEAQACIHVNGSPLVESDNRETCSGTGQFHSLKGSALVQLSASDTVDLRFTTSNGDDVTVYNVNLTVKRRGITAAGASDDAAIHDNIAGEINAITEKVTPVNADQLLIEDSAAGNAKKKIQIGNIPGIGGAKTFQDFTPQGSPPTHTEGRIYFDDVNQSLNVQNDEVDITMNLGQENWVRVINNTGVTITNGQAVYISGYDIGSDLPEISLAQANTLATAECIGLATHDIEDATIGFVTEFGVVNDLNTAAFADAAAVYVDATTPGALTTTPPVFPNYDSRVGVVKKSNATTGAILVLLGEPVRTGVDEDAIHDNEAGEIAAITAKATPIAADYLLIEDSAAANAKKSITMGDIDHDALTNFVANEHLDWTQSVGTIHTDNYIEGGPGTDTTAIHDDTAGEIAAVTAKTPLVGADLFLIEDSAAANAKKSATVADIRITESQITDLDHDDVDAIHDNVAGEIAAVTAKATPVGADILLVEDSAAANAKKSVTIASLETALEAVLDHDDLQGFVANEHLDWTQSVGTIHTDNYIEGGPGTDTTAIHDDTAGEIAAVTAKTPLVAGDLFLIEDSAAANVKKSATVADIRITESQITDLDHNDADAIHDNVAGEINAVTLKASPAGADVLLLEDSAAGFAKVKATITSIQGAGSGDNVSVNGVSATDVDFDDATPAAPAGGVNVKWQKDTSAPDNVSAHLAANDIVNTVLADMAQSTIKGRAVGAGTGDPTDLTATQATAILNAFTSGLKGLAPASGGGTTNFLRADGTWAAPAAGGVFGEEFQYGESLATQTETGSTFVQKFRFTTTSLPAGDYFVFMSAGVNTSNASRIGEFRFQEDDVDVFSGNINKENGFSTKMWFDHRTLSAATHTFDFEIRDDGSGPSATISIANMRVVLWRVS